MKTNLPCVFPAKKMDATLLLSAKSFLLGVVAVSVKSGFMHMNIALLYFFNNVDKIRINELLLDIRTKVCLEESTLSSIFQSFSVAPPAAEGWTVASRGRWWDMNTLTDSGDQALHWSPPAWRNIRRGGLSPGRQNLPRGASHPVAEIYRGGPLTRLHFYPNRC